MSSLHLRAERHRVHNTGWLRAAVLGANDGLISTASLLVGVSAADLERTAVLKTGLAALVAGALSMGAGEYVSVSAQADAEAADIEKETAEIRDHHDAELHELAAIYRGRGLSQELATQVAVAMHEHDALEAHLRDELSITDLTRANPLQAAWSSALAFATGAVVALAAAVVARGAASVWVIAIVTLVALGALGVTGARLGGATAKRGAIRVLVSGAIALGVAAVLGNILGTTL